MTSTPGGTTTILDIMRNQFPHLVIRSNGRHFRVTCPVCPSRSGNTLTIASHGNWHKCFSGTSHEGNTAAFIAVLGGTPQEQIAQVRVASEQRRKEGWIPPDGATIPELCQDKGINEPWARKEMLWTQSKHWGVDAIRMPVLDINGEYLATRYRVSIAQRTKTVSESGASLHPYGLWLLDKNAPELTLVEGETDTAAMSYHGFQVLGLPGVNTWRSEWRQYLSEIGKVYIWEEPGNIDPKTGLTPGQTMVKSCSRSLGQVYVIKAPPEAKDPAELALLYGDKFPERMRELMQAALPEDHSIAEEESEQQQGDQGYRRPEEQRRALVKARMAALYDIRRTCANRLRGLASVELGTLHAGYLKRQYRKLLDSLPILLANPLSAPDQEDLVSLREKVEQDLQHAENLEKCGWVMGAMCAEHGERFRTNHSCRLPDHAACPTKTTEKLRVLTLPVAPPHRG